MGETILNFSREKLLIALYIILFHSLAFPQGFDNIDPIGEFRATWFSEMVDVELVGNRAWVAGVGGLTAFNISDPNDPDFPVFTGGRYAPSPDSDTFGARFYHSAIGTDLAYASGRLDGISVINITNLNFLQRVSLHIEEGVSYEGLYLDANYLYAARHEKGLEIFDLVSESILSIGVYENLTNAWTVVVQAGIAYVTDGRGGLKILDVSDPTNVSELSAMATSAPARDMDVVDGIAYVAVGSQGLDIFDVSDPSSPFFLSNYQSPFFTAGVSVVGDRAYLAEWDIVEVIDVTNRQAPFLLGWEEMTMRGMGIAARDSLLYVANWLNFNVLRFGNTQEPDIFLPETFYFFGDTPLGSSSDSIIIVQNTGSSILLVDSITSNGADFTLEPDFLNIEPGGIAEVKLIFTPEDTNNTQAVISFWSNDPDESRRTLVARGYTKALRNGDDAPDFTLNDIDGVPHSLSDYAGKVIVLSLFASW
ncbi:MAG: redoxin domain-containing protein [Candidatus Marinimicrobia bacterium]|nr:redoxin domain-containing protein [Candidatus Neomarinimicrobiota bacterium]